jgi:hypothetical protein
MNTTSTSFSSAYSSAVLWPSLGLGLLTLIGIWALFIKAGKPGWWAIIPFVNSFVLCKVGGKPGWWFILFAIPVVNLVFIVLVYRGVARNFGKGVGFTVGLIFLPFIFFMILGFGQARFNGPYGNQPLSAGPSYPA